MDASDSTPGSSGGTDGGGSIEAEVASQPGCWLRAAGLAAEVAGILPARGERVAVAGCGTSWFIAQSYAAARARGLDPDRPRNLSRSVILDTARPG